MRHVVCASRILVSGSRLFGACSSGVWSPDRRHNRPTCPLVANGIGMTSPSQFIGPPPKAFERPNRNWSDLHGFFPTLGWVTAAFQLALLWAGHTCSEHSSNWAGDIVAMSCPRARPVAKPAVAFDGAQPLPQEWCHAQGPKKAMATLSCRKESCVRRPTFQTWSSARRGIRHPTPHTGRRLEWRGWRWTQRQGSMKPRLFIELHRSAHTAGWFEAAESAKAHIAIAGRLLVFGAPIAHAVCAILASALLGILLCACAGSASICASSVLMLPWLVGVALLPQTERRPAT